MFTFLLFLVMFFIAGVAGLFLLEARRGLDKSAEFPDGKSVVGIFIHNSIIAKIFLPKAYIAVAVWKWVLIKDGILSEDMNTHELRHILQWQEEGFFGFLWRYFNEHRKYGYACNRFEEDARWAAGQPLRCEGDA